MNLQDGARAPFLLEGNRGIARAEESLASLRQALADSESIVVDCTTVTAADLSFIQLLLATRRSAMATGKSFTVTARTDGPLHGALVAGGFLAGPDLCSFIQFTA